MKSIDYESERVNEQYRSVIFMFDECMLKMFSIAAESVRLR